MLPKAGVNLVAENLEQFKGQMREANEAVRNMGRESRTGMQRVRDQITGVISVVGGLTAGVFMLSRAYASTIGEFVRYARQVRETAAATGQQAEEVSRLIQLMDDFEIDAGTLTMVMRAMRDEGLTPSVETLAQLSDEFLALEPGAARVNFLIDHFGRSGAVFADLMLQGGDAIRERAAAISDSLILDERELQLARDQEIAMDDLHDAVQGAGLAIAQDLTPPVTEAARALALLLTWNQRINAALGEQQDEILQTADSYHEYLLQVLAAAVAAGKLNESQANLIAGIASGSIVLAEQSPFALGAYRRAMEDAAEAGIILDEAQWEVARSTAAQTEAIDQGSDATARFAEGMGRLDDETLQVRDRIGEVGPAAARSFGEVDTSLASTIDRMREDAAWIAGGGLQLQQAAGQVNQLLQSGAITPEQADAMFQPIEAAALGLQEDIGQITMSQATQQMAEDWGLTWGDARTQIQGAQQDIANIPQQVRTQIAVEVQWNVTHGGAGRPAGHQHGGNFIIPQGYENDTYPILASSGERVIIVPAQAAGPQTTIYNQQDYSSRSIAAVNMGAGDNPYEFDRRMKRWMGM